MSGSMYGCYLLQIFKLNLPYRVVRGNSLTQVYVAGGGFWEKQVLLACPQCGTQSWMK